jgi:hypothetical protein
MKDKTEIIDSKKRTRRGKKEKKAKDSDSGIRF